MTVDLLRRFANIHAHGITGPEIITSIEPNIDITTAYGDAWYSVGVHPWSTDKKIAPEVFERLKVMAADSRVVAIGETGLDKNRGGDSAVQEQIFRFHAVLAEEMIKPLIVHCVGRYGRLMELKHEISPTQSWIIHGFTGKPELARQLLAAGFYISLGLRSNPNLRSLIPEDRRFEETD